MNVFVVREIKDAFETVKDLEKIGVKSKSLPITKCNYKTIPNYKIKYDFILLTSAKSITIFIRFINLYKKIHNKIPKIFVVGIETANALKKNSYDDFFVSEGNSKSLSELVISNTKIYSKGLWLHRKRVLKTKLLENKRFLKENIVYEMAFRDLSTNLQINENECFSNNAFIVNSSRNIKLLTRTLNKLKTFENLLKKSKIFCMSADIKEEALSLGWKNILILKKNSRKSFLKEVKIILDSN
jgi:uroporphyrinogen-III synthase